MADLITHPEWNDDSQTGLRVLVEAANWSDRQALTQALRRHGHRTATCPGPEGADARCPLVGGAECRAAAEADVVIHTLRPSDARNRGVLLALQRHHPSTRLIVEVPAPWLATHRDDYGACSLVETPMTPRALLAALEATGDEGRTTR